MADKVTSTKKTDPNDEINALLDQAKDKMVAAGMPPDQADALLNAARPNSAGTVVGNYADLQRMGAIAQTGVMPTPPGEDDVETSNIEEAFTENEGEGTVNIDEDRLAFAHRLPDVTPAQEAADERHAKEASASDAGTAPKKTTAKAE